MGFWKRDKQNNDKQQALRKESLQKDLIHAQESQSLDKSPKQLSKEANQKQQADQDMLKCLFSELSSQNGSTPKSRNRPYKVRNLLDSSEAVDTLHLQGDVSLTVKEVFGVLLEKSCSENHWKILTKYF